MHGVLGLEGCRGGSTAGWYRRAVSGGIVVAALLTPGLAAAQQNASPGANAGGVPLPEIRVIGTAPVPPQRRPARRAATTAASATRTVVAAEPGPVDRDKLPANIQTLSAADFDHATAPSMLDAIERGLPGVALGDQTGNEFQRDVNYRGFVASPVIGTPQGLAVY
jgi:iron complex outermembrane receptor protein